MKNNLVAELVVDCKNQLGEGTFYDNTTGLLWWVNIPLPSKLFCLTTGADTVREWQMPEMISYAVPKASGGLLICAHGGLSSFTPDDVAYQRLKTLEPLQPFNRCNDACCDPNGNLWVGTMQNNLTPDGSPLAISQVSGNLHRVEPSLTAAAVVTDIAISNSCCFSPDGKKMYFCDTPRNIIWSYDLDLATGKITNQHDFATYDRGLPDGSTVDAQGCVWNARYGGGCVVRFTPDGTLDKVVEVPASNVTCCTFGSVNLETLYITTARTDQTESQLANEPYAGGLFAVNTGSKGVPDVPFAG